VVPLIQPYDDFEDRWLMAATIRVWVADGAVYAVRGGLGTATGHWKCAPIVGDAPTWRMDTMPYGGVKDSGLGREGVRWAIEEMTEPRMLVMTGM